MLTPSVVACRFQWPSLRWSHRLRSVAVATCSDNSPVGLGAARALLDGNWYSVIVPFLFWRTLTLDIARRVASGSLLTGSVRAVGIDQVWPFFKLGDRNQFADDVHRHQPAFLREFGPAGGNRSIDFRVGKQSARFDGRARRGVTGANCCLATVAVDQIFLNEAGLFCGQAHAWMVAGTLADDAPRYPANKSAKSQKACQCSAYHSEMSTTASDDPELLDRVAAAKFLGVSPATLATWKTRNAYGLPLVKVGGRVKYLKADLIAFIERRRQCLTPTTTAT